MSEIPESLRGTYTTGTFQSITIRVTMNATTMGSSVSARGQSMVLLDETSPDAKLHNITIVDGGKETESVTFNASEPGGKPDTGSVLTLNKDGLTFNDHIVSKIVDLILMGGQAANPNATKEHMDLARPAVTAVAEQHFKHLTRYEGGEGGSLPLMVGGGAALLLLLMVK